MSQKMFFIITGVIFSVITALHVARIAFEWRAVIGVWSIPVWVSWIAVLIAVYFAYQSFRLYRETVQ